VPLFATLTFDLSAGQPSLTAVITNAVLEGGAPFALTVRSSSGSQLVDGSYRLSGDYLRDIYPSGTQYLFDWRFSVAADGSVVWNGYSYWAGGHIWQVTLANITLGRDYVGDQFRRPRFGVRHQFARCWLEPRDQRGGLHGRPPFRHAGRGHAYAVFSPAQAVTYERSRDPSSPSLSRLRWVVVFALFFVGAGLALLNMEF
jgi:hypothetical protein